MEKLILRSRINHEGAKYTTDGTSLGHGEDDNSIILLYHVNV
jgi:hypothetical protein